MNDLELEQLAHRAAEHARAEGARIADSRSVLAVVLGGHPVPDTTPDDDGTGPFDPIPERVRHRSRWVPVLAAAAAIVAVAGVVLTLRDDAPDRIVVTTEPERPDDPEGTIVETVPDTTEPMIPTPSSSVPGGSPQIPIDEVVAVPDEVGPHLARTVLATFGAGDGPGELGFEDCAECERQVVPWTPIVTGDGTVYVADVWNERWQLFRDGEWTAVPFAESEVVVADPVVGPDGLIYAAVADALDPVNPRRVVAYEAGIVPTATYEVPASRTLLVTRLDIVDGDVLRFGFSEIRRFELALGSPTWDVDLETWEVSLALSGIFRQFRLPTTWELSDEDATALDDGSIVLHARASIEQQATGGSFLVRLWPDGVSATGSVGTTPITANLDGRFTGTGFVQLEDGEIVEYAYPQRPPVDIGTTVVSGLDPQPVEPEELYRAGIGDGVDELGRELCEECEPAVPWSPVVLPDGRIVIVDNANRRWITVTEGVPSVTPLPDRMSIVGQPLVDAEGRVVVVAQIASAASPGVVAFFDPDDLSSPVEEVPVTALVFSQLELDGSDVVVNGRVVAGLRTSVGVLPNVEYGLDRSPATVTVTWSGERRTWQYPVTVSPGGGIGLPDGSITNTVFDGDQRLLVRLLPNGNARAIALPTPTATNGATSTTLDGHVQLELDDGQWVVRRYPLPG